jgi:hypothetical protein
LNPEEPAFEAQEWYGLTYGDYAVMGLVAVRFQELDAAVSALVWTLIADRDVFGPGHSRGENHRHQEIGSIITAGLFSFQRKLSVAVALALKRFVEWDVEHLQEVAKKCLAAETERNQMIHSWWLPMSRAADGTPRTARVKHGLDYKRGLTDPFEAHERVDRVALLSLAERMAVLIKEVGTIRSVFYPMKKKGT